MADCIPFEPGFINIPIYLHVHERDEDNMGVSQLDVFLSALFAYHKEVTTRDDTNDKEVALNLIEDMRDTALDVVYNRMSECADLLHKLKYYQSR